MSKFYVYYIVNLQEVTISTTEIFLLFEPIYLQVKQIFKMSVVPKSLHIMKEGSFLTLVT